MNKILQKLLVLRSTINVEKEQGRSYKAFTIKKLNAELNPALDELKIGVSFAVKDVKNEIGNKKWGVDKYGVNFERYTYITTGTVDYIIADLESDDYITVTCPFFGMNEEGDPSKSCGNAHSYSYKYLWLTLLGITDEETDPDSIYNQNNKMLEDQISSSGAESKSKEDSKAACEKYLKALNEMDSMPVTAINKAGITTRLKKAEEAVTKDTIMLHYEKTKVQNKIKQVKTDWEIE
ncbi:MAG: ERF family protein [Bacteroidetes bacterium]|nr:ERF family protein [Bacteroidota bacterium]